MVRRVSTTVYRKNPVTGERDEGALYINTPGGRVAANLFVGAPDSGGTTTPPPAEFPLPENKPFPPDHPAKTSVGSGMTFLSTGSAQHQNLLVDSGQTTGLAPGYVKVAIAHNDWSEGVWRSSPTDPSFTLRHVEYLPASYLDLANDEPLPWPQAVGPTIKELHGVRVPDAARWMSLGNTDRKVILVLGYDWTDSSTGTFYPAGTATIGMQKFCRTTQSGLILCTHLTRNNIKDGYGLLQGAIASGTDPIWGLIRVEEIQAAVAGDVLAIDHVLQLGIGNPQLKDGPIWPARTQDGDAATKYTGQNPYGTHLVLLPTFDIEAHRISGQPLTNVQKAVLYCLRDYGAYVGIRSNSAIRSLNFKIEAGLTSEGGVDPIYATQIDDAITSVMSSLRISANSHLVGTLDSERMPVNRSLIAGGGTRARPTAPAFSPTGPWVPGDPNALRQVVTWGDSLTASTGTNWPGTTLQTLLGIPVSNMGVSGMGTMDIGLRQGGVKPLLTVTGNSIPASGSVAVTAISPSTGWRINGTGSFTRTGTVAGVAGTLSHDLVADTWTFTRTTAAASASPCPAESEFVGTSLLTNHERMVSVFWTGRNSLNALSQIPVATAAMVAKLTTNPKRFVVLSMTNTSSETQGTANLTNILAMNAGLASTYPNNYIDIRSYLASTQALTDAGITPTSQDNTDIANNVIPTSLRADSTHLNAAGYTRVANKVAAFIQAKGWA